MYTFILPMAVPSETVTSTTTSCDCTSLIVTVIDNGPSSLSLNMLTAPMIPLIM